MKSEVKIGDIIEIQADLNIYHLYTKRKCKVVAIYPKKCYNMYLCKSVNSNVKYCVTDQDIICTHTVKKLTE